MLINNICVGSIVVDGNLSEPYGPIRVECHKRLFKILSNGFVYPSKFELVK